MKKNKRLPKSLQPTLWPVSPSAAYSEPHSVGRPKSLKIFGRPTNDRSCWTKALCQKLAQASALVLALVLMPSIAAAQAFEDIELSKSPLVLKGQGSFFIEGETQLINADTSFGGASIFPGRPGLSMINQMYVQFMLPQQQKGKKHVPIGFVHGCCLTTKSWQTTPDGRMGWEEYFVRQGFDTYMMDQVGRGRSGFDATKYNRVRTDQLECTSDGTAGPDGNSVVCHELPPILIATDQFAWNVFRWGVTPCTQSPCSETTMPHPNLEFPLDTIGVGQDPNLQFYNMVVPDMSATVNPGFFPPPSASVFFETPSQMAKLASKVGGMTLVGHSQSSSFPTRAALQPESGCFPWTSAEACNIKGIVQIETGCFDNLTKDEINTLRHIPILVVRGDFYPESVPASCQAMLDDINEVGGDMKLAVLPELVSGDLFPGSPGPMPGVEHMMMIGTKNIEVADLLIGWLSSRGL